MCDIANFVEHPRDLFMSTLFENWVFLVLQHVISKAYYCQGSQGCSILPNPEILFPELAT